jgi:hypothetical protein
VVTLLLCADCEVIIGCEKSLDKGVLQRYCNNPCPELFKDGCPYLQAKKARKTLHRCELCEVEDYDED